MTGNAERLTGTNVRPRLTLVNTLVRVPAATDVNEPGRRLEGYVKEHWTRRDGGIRKLAARMGTSAETLYAWFRGETEPNLAHLRSLAELLEVSRADLVAVMDGETPAGAVEERLRALEAAVALLARSAAEAPQVPSAPRQKVG